MEVAHPTPAGSLVPDGVVLLADGSSAFVEIHRTTSCARLVAKLERYDAYRNAPLSGHGNAARAPRSHWQETYAGPSLDRPFPPVLFVCRDDDPAPADPARARPTGVAGRRQRPRRGPLFSGRAAEGTVSTVGPAWAEAGPTVFSTLSLSVMAGRLVG